MHPCIHYTFTCTLTYTCSTTLGACIHAFICRYTSAWWPVPEICTCPPTSTLPKDTHLLYINLKLPEPFHLYLHLYLVARSGRDGCGATQLTF